MHALNLDNHDSERGGFIAQVGDKLNRVFGGVFGLDAVIFSLEQLL